MPPLLALLIATIFIVVAYRRDRECSGSVSGLLFWPTLWYLVVSSRPFGVWLGIWGVPLPGGSNDPTEGSGIDRYFFALISAIGVMILLRRRFEWGQTLVRNPWIPALLAFAALSILWSQYPYVSFKRYIKLLGSIAMALVVLTDPRPLEATLTVIRRCFYIHLPMSIVCTRYFREIGVSFDYTGSAESWIGIATSKNTLGQITMLGVLYFSWEVWRNWEKSGWKNLHFLYLLMAAYLLRGSSEAISMTSLSVSVFAIVVFFRIQSLRAQPERAQRFIRLVFAATVSLIAFVLIHSVVLFSDDSFFGGVIKMLGRDITLTGRTEIWSDVYAAAAGNPLLGVGFGGFWIGRIANIPWNANMSWVLGQGHSGYVDTYLQLGYLGSFLFAGVIFATLPRLLASLAEDFDFGCFRITLFLTILFVNITESTVFRGDHHLWFIMQLVIWVLPTRELYREAKSVK